MMMTPTDDMNEDKNSRLNNEQTESVGFVTAFDAIRNVQKMLALKSTDNEKMQNEETEYDDATLILDTVRLNDDDT